MRIAFEKVLNPVENVIWYVQPGILLYHSAVTHDVKCLGKIQSLDNDEWMSSEESGDSDRVEKFYESCSNRPSGLKSILVIEADSNRRTPK
jgi:hypothetical protein